MVLFLLYLAFFRPDLSIGVTFATLENWEYAEIIRLAADPECSASLQTSVEAIDNVLSIPGLKRVLKGLFGLAGLEHDDDFVSLLEVNWAPCFGESLV